MAATSMPPARTCGAGAAAPNGFGAAAGSAVGSTTGSRSRLGRRAAVGSTQAPAHRLGCGSGCRRPARRRGPLLRPRGLGGLRRRRGRTRPARVRLRQRAVRRPRRGVPARSQQVGPPTGTPSTSRRRSRRSRRAAYPLSPEAAGQQHARADQLELQPRRGGAGHLGEAGVDDVGGARQRAAAEGAPTAGASARAGPRARRAAPTDAPSGHRGDDDEVAQPLEQVLDEPARVVPGLDDPVDLVEDAGGVAPRRTRR